MRYVKIIGERFRISFSGQLTSYLNIAIEHDHAGRTVYLSQTRYIEEMIAQFDIPLDKSVKDADAAKLEANGNWGGESIPEAVAVCG